MLQTAREGLSKYLESFINDGQLFAAAPTATPEEKRLAALEVLRELLYTSN